MGTNRLRKANRAFNVVVISFVAILFVTFFLIWMDTGSKTRDLESTYTSLQYMWTHADGSYGELDVLEGEESFYLSLNGEQINGGEVFPLEYEYLGSAEAKQYTLARNMRRNRAAAGGDAKGAPERENKRK